MSKKHLLFICTGNLQRSPTAEAIFRGSSEYEAKSAGTEAVYRTQVTQELVDWASEIFVMEREHVEYLKRELNVAGKPIHNLDIPDIYEQDDPRLIKILNTKLKGFLN